MRWLSPWVAMVLLLGACGDDDGDGAPPDSGIDAGVDAGPRDLGQPPAPIALQRILDSLLPPWHLLLA